MILIISKSGEISQKNIKSYENLYSLCNYRNNNNFELLHTWNNEICLYGKRSGRSGYENNYKFPIPLENEQYYGTLCIIKKINDNYAPITLNEWTNIYNKMMGQENTTNILNSPIINYINDKELTHEEYETENESDTEN